MALASIIMISAAITIPLTGSILHSHPTHAQTPSWSASGNILLPRYSFRATTLPNGKVLIEGGFAPGSYTTDSELFDPTTGVWTQTGSLNQGRGEHSATLLQDGRILVAGGYAGPVLNSAEIYDPATGTWTLTGSMSQVRTRHAATILQNGMVLVAGGWDGSPISGAEIYNRATGSWSSAGNMFIPRADGAAIQLLNGKVLVAGGDFANSNGITGESELYDPATNSWSATGSMNVARGGFDAVLLPNGKVLATGGSDSTGAATTTAELYDPATGIWTLTGSMQQARFLGLGLQALMLADGTVFVAGGDTAGTSEVYDPSTGTWNSLTKMTTPHCGAVTALLSDGRPLIAGGTDCASNLTTVTELYTLSSPPPPTPSPTSITPHNQLVIFLQGIDTALSLGDIQKQIKSGHSAPSIVGMGNIPATVSKALPSNAQFFEFSYAGSGLLTGNPIKYDCQDTFSQPITTDISLLQQQISRIVATEPKGTETDLYLIGHSLGGAVVFGYLDFLENHLLVPLPSSVHLKAVITLDAPLGGVHDFWTESFVVHQVYDKSCNLKGVSLNSPPDLTTVLDSTVPPFHTTPPNDGEIDPLGAQASFLILSTPNPDPNITIPSNLSLAEQAQTDLGTSFLTIGNVNDFVWNTQACNLLLPGFVDTQWIEDGGDNSGLYGRSFQYTATCPGLTSPKLADAVIASHTAVLFNGDVQAGIMAFLTPSVGGTPGNLTPQLDIG